MAVDFSLPSWLTPKEAPWHALVAGVQAGSQIASNMLRSKQLYAELQQQQQRQELADKQFVMQNETYTLANEVTRAKLENDTADFATLREWWPQYASSQGEDLMALEPPNLHDTDKAVRVSGLLSEKKRKQATVNFARDISDIGDLSLPENQARYLMAFSNNPEAVSRAGGVDVILKPIEAAEKLAANREAALARVTQQRDAITARMDFLYEQLATTDATRTEANRISKLRADTQALLADSTIGVNDERVKKLVADTEAIGARTSIAQGNLEQRKIKNQLSRDRLQSRLNDVQYQQFQSELSAAQRANRKDPEKLRAAEEAVYEKWNKVLAPSAAPPPAAQPSTNNPLGLNLKLK